MKEAFFYHDSDKDGVISGVAALDCLRSVGLKADTDKINEKIEAKGGSLKVEDLVEIANSLSSENEDEKGLIEAFRMFDSTGSGGISIDDLKAVLAMTGREPSDADLKAMTSSIKMSDGKIKYEEFVKEHFKL